MQAVSVKQARGVEVRGPMRAGYDAILTPEALELIADLTRTFRAELKMRLVARRAPRPLSFLPDTAAVRSGDWAVAPLPEDLLDRRVEITGPTDRKMVINALSSGANVFMADFEDSLCPTWDNLLRGQINLRDAVRRTITFESAGKRYALGDKVATLMVRPRGLHLVEKHLFVDGEPVPGALFDFALYFFHNARELIARGTGPYFYVPKLENHLEARLWNGVFLRAENALGIARGTIKATVLIETLPAAFEMDEILFELREHVVGLNCGRWDYIFSVIKKRAHEDVVLPDRGALTMDKSFLRAYSELLIKTCHRRGAFAMGGMAAYIPVKDPEANAVAIEKVRGDKLREARAGHDGTWVAHPGLVPIAKQIFDEHMPQKNQLHVRREDVNVGPRELLEVPEGPRTMESLRHDVRVGIRYIEAWLGGLGCVPLYNLMEDAATAEISRALVWQWIHKGATASGEEVTKERVRGIIGEEMKRIASEVEAARFSQGHFEEARALFEDLVMRDDFQEFLTLSAYEQVTTRGE